MKIALVNPPDENRIYSEVPSGVSRETGILPPMGLLYLESSLANRTDHQVKIFDFPATGTGHKLAAEELKKFAPDVLGVTGHTHNLIDMLEISKTFKKMNPDGLVVWGGAHASAFPQQSKTFSAVDFVISGEGEIAFIELLDAAEKGTGLKTRTTTSGGETGLKTRTMISGGEMDLSQLTHPRREVLDVRNYSYGVGEGKMASGFVSSRGCPFYCTFCSTPGRKFRSRSPLDVLNEMEECKELGIQELYFVDDTFNLDEERVKEICRKIIERNIKISWAYRGRVSNIDGEQLELSRKAGCTRIQLGIETSSDEGLAMLKKGITTDEIRRVFKLVKESGITSMAYFMIGCPHEKTKDDVLRTIDFAIELEPDYALFGILIPYPGTEIYNTAVERGLIEPQAWEDFVTNPKLEFTPSPWPEFFTSGELEEFIDLAYQRFYGRPGYALKQLMQVKSISELVRKVRIGSQILLRK